MLGSPVTYAGNNACTIERWKARKRKTGKSSGLWGKRSQFLPRKLTGAMWGTHALSLPSSFRASSSYWIRTPLGSKASKTEGNCSPMVVRKLTSSTVISRPYLQIRNRLLTYKILTGSPLHRFLRIISLWMVFLNFSQTSRIRKLQAQAVYLQRSWK